MLLLIFSSSKVCVSPKLFGLAYEILIRCQHLMSNSILPQTEQDVSQWKKAVCLKHGKSVAGIIESQNRCLRQNICQVPKEFLESWLNSANDCSLNRDTSVYIMFSSQTSVIRVLYPHLLSKYHLGAGIPKSLLLLDNYLPNEGMTCSFIIFPLALWI